MSKRTYDSKCWDLADAFLSDTPHLHATDNVEALAIEIQQAIESFIEDKQRNYEPAETGDAFSGGFAENH